MVLRGGAYRKELDLDSAVRMEPPGLNPGGFIGRGSEVRQTHAQMHTLSLLQCGTLHYARKKDYQMQPLDAAPPEQ
jgi:hypothetical protein